MPKYQATRTVFVVRIFLDNFTGENGFRDFNVIYITLGHLPHSMVGEEYLAALYKLLDRQNIHKRLFEQQISQNRHNAQKHRERVRTDKAILQFAQTLGRGADGVA